MFPIIVLDIVLLFVVVRLSAGLLQRYRFAARMAPATIAELKPGWARLSGRIREEEGTLVSPISERRCVYYHLLVKERQDQGPSELVVDDRQHCLFVLDDQTGHILVNSHGGIMHLEEIVNSSARSAHVLAERYGETMATASLLKFVRRRPLCFEECLLQVGQQITVMGQVKLDEYQRPHLCPPLHIYDRPGPKPATHGVLLLLVLGVGLVLVVLFPFFFSFK